MENATKALLISAAVLIVIILIALGVMLLRNSSGTSKQADEAGKTVSETSDTLINGVNTVKVILQDYGNSKLKAIKIVKSITGLGLKEAKNFVEMLPQTLIEGITENEAKDLKRQFEEFGATVTIKVLKNENSLVSDLKNLQSDSADEQYEEMPHMYGDFGIYNFLYSVILVNYNNNKKSETIKLVSQITGERLEEATEMIKNLPLKVITVSQDEAEDIKSKFEAIGANIEIKMESAAVPATPAVP